MQIEIRIDEECKEPKITVTASKMTDEINAIIKRLSDEQPQVIAGFREDNVNCQRRTRTHDAALQRRKPSMGSSSSCRAHHKAPFRRQQIGKHLRLAVLEYFFTNFTRFFFSPSFSSFGYPARHESSPQSCRTMSHDVA